MNQLMSQSTFTPEEIWQALDEIQDPEIPVVSLVEMGIVRDVTVEATGRVMVKMTPTFAGCPALHVMREDIVTK
jgi:ring-1,2-phenylacetyl-CoA epoxidase subunit PaaD